MSKTAAPPYVQAPKIAHPHDPMDLNKLDLTIGALTTSNPPPPNRSISPSMPARSIILELYDEYRRNNRYVRYGLKDHWVRNYSLAPYIALAGDTITGKGKQVIVVAVNDEDYDDYSDSDDENGSGFGAAVDKIMIDRPELGWRRYVGTGAWK